MLYLRTFAGYNIQHLSPHQHHISSTIKNHKRVVQLQQQISVLASVIDIIVRVTLMWRIDYILRSEVVKPWLICNIQFTFLQLKLYISIKNTILGYTPSPSIQSTAIQVDDTIVFIIAFCVSGGLLLVLVILVITVLLLLSRRLTRQKSGKLF